MTTVSIVTPTYNRASTLKEAIQSIKSQTYSDYEHIIVDDGSTDETHKIVTSIEDERIQYLPLEGNQGANTARNRGIEAADGKYIAFLDSDDRYHPEKLERCVRELAKLSENKYAGVFHSMKFVDHGNIIDVNIINSGDNSIDDLKNGNSIGGFTDVMLRAQVFKEVGLLEEDLPAYQDYEFFLRLLDRYNMWGIPEPLSIKRKSIPDGSAARISDRLETKSQAQELLLKKHSDLLSKRVKSEFCYTRGLLRMNQGDVTTARKEFKQAMNIYPKNMLYYYHYLATFGGHRIYRLAMLAKRKIKLIFFS